MSQRVETRALAAGVPVTGLELREGVRSHAVGRGLHQAEQEFIARLVRRALREAGDLAAVGETTASETTTTTTLADEAIDGGSGDAPVLLSRL